MIGIQGFVKRFIVGSRSERSGQLLATAMIPVPETRQTAPSQPTRSSKISGLRFRGRFGDHAAHGAFGLVMRFARSRPTTGSEKVEKFYLERGRITPSVSARPGGHLVG
jgi:hypothetical protein